MKLKTLVVSSAVIGCSLTHALPTSWNWATDRIDGKLDGQYSYTYTGQGQNVYIVDSGININNSSVQREFGGRLTVYDMNETLPTSDSSYVSRSNPNYGRDYIGHGTKTASLVGSKTYGLAKGANIIMAKVYKGNSSTGSQKLLMNALKEFKGVSKAGDILIINLDLTRAADTAEYSKAKFEALLKDIHNQGVIIVMPFGNSPYDPSKVPGARLSEVFGVSATDEIGLLSPAYVGSNFSNRTIKPSNQIDYTASFYDVNQSTNTLQPDQTRVPVGQLVSAYLPGQSIWALDENGNEVRNFGITSAAAPYAAGIFAVFCERFAPMCSTQSPSYVYNYLLNTSGQYGTVYDAKGNLLTPRSGKSRFLLQRY